MHAPSSTFLNSSALASTKVRAQAPAPAPSPAHGNICQEPITVAERCGTMAVEQQPPAVTAQFFPILRVPVCA